MRVVVTVNPRLPKKIRDALVEAAEEFIEAGNVPEDCLHSALISRAAYECRPRCWALVSLKTGKTFYIDLRNGKP